MGNTEIVRGEGRRDGRREGSREGPERRRETLERLDRERDIWLSTSHSEHGPHQVPLWFWWDGAALWMCTGETSVTVRNARQEPRVRLALPDTVDVVLVQGEAECFPAPGVPRETGDGFAAKFGWDPREEEGSFVYLRVTPMTVRAWCGEHELTGRVLMRAGAWVV